MTKRDIENRADIKKLVSIFHERLLSDPEFKYIFLEVAQVDILAHMEIVTDFWERVLFRADKYKNQLVDTHLELNQKYHFALGAKHFERWLEVFTSSVEEHYEGIHARNMMNTARSIAAIIIIKIDYLEKARREINN